MELVLLNRIEDNPYQPRRLYRDIPELALKIYDMHDNLPDTLGLIHVPTGRLLKDGTVQLAEGHRRLRAFRYMFEEEGELDYAALPVNILELDDQAMDDIAWDENKDRSDLTPVEEARALKRTLETRNITQAELAQIRRMGRSSVTNKLRLLKLSDDVLDAIENEVITERHGMELLPAFEIPAADLEIAANKLTGGIAFQIKSAFNRPTPETLKRRLISPDVLPALTSSDVRQVVEDIKRVVEAAKKQRVVVDQEWQLHSQAAKEALSDVRTRTDEPGADASQWLEPGPEESPPSPPVVEASAQPAPGPPGPPPPSPPPPPPPPAPKAEAPARPADLHISITVKPIMDDLAASPVLMTVARGQKVLVSEQIHYSQLLSVMETAVENHLRNSEQGDKNGDDLRV